MKKFGTTAGLLALFALVSGVMAADEKVSIKDIMKKTTVGKKSLFSQIKEKSMGDIVWDDVSKLTADMAKITAPLPKAEPSKGDKDLWKKHAEEWVKHTETLDKAAKDKNKENFTKEVTTMGKSCGVCHKEHK